MTSVTANALFKWSLIAVLMGRRCLYLEGAGALGTGTDR